MWVNRREFEALKALVLHNGDEISQLDAELYSKQDSSNALSSQVEMLDKLTRKIADVEKGVYETLHDNIRSLSMRIDKLENKV